jgi:hypothetical protein
MKLYPEHEEPFRTASPRKPAGSGANGCPTLGPNLHQLPDAPPQPLKESNTQETLIQPANRFLDRTVEFIVQPPETNAWAKSTPSQNAFVAVPRRIAKQVRSACGLSRSALGVWLLRESFGNSCEERQESKVTVPDISLDRQERPRMYAA